MHRCRIFRLHFRKIESIRSWYQQYPKKYERFRYRCHRFWQGHYEMNSCIVKIFHCWSVLQRSLRDPFKDSQFQNVLRSNIFFEFSKKYFRSYRSIDFIKLFENPDLIGFSVCNIDNRALFIFNCLFQSILAQGTPEIGFSRSENPKNH